MSALRPGEERMHHQDNSHRWIAPPGVDQEDWRQTVLAHLDEHLKQFGPEPARVPPGRPGRGW